MRGLPASEAEIGTGQGARPDRYYPCPNRPTRSLRRPILHCTKTAVS